MSVAVVSKTGMLLMPTSEYRARKLLKSKKAIIHGYHPFTIQLTEREKKERPVIFNRWNSAWTLDIYILEHL